MGCRQADFKQALVRLSSGNGEVRLDLAGKLGGRGGYLHARRECLQLFVKAKVSRFSSLGCGVERIERVNLVNSLVEKLAGPTASSKPGPLIQ